MSQTETKNRGTSLWVHITQDGLQSRYKVRTVFGVEGVTVRRVLSKFIEGAATGCVYVVDQLKDRLIPPWESNCVCNCPQWLKTKEDCKHILALRSHALVDLLSERKQ